MTLGLRSCIKIGQIVQTITENHDYMFILLSVYIFKYKGVDFCRTFDKHFNIFDLMWAVTVFFLMGKFMGKSQKILQQVHLSIFGII